MLFLPPLKCYLPSLVIPQPGGLDQYVMTPANHGHIAGPYPPIDSLHIDPQIMGRLLNAHQIAAGMAALDIINGAAHFTPSRNFHKWPSIRIISRSQ